jgi:DNA repair photolyase
MSIIYEPRGAAKEYSPLAANLYRGCGHGCLYCYAPQCLRMSREEFSRDPRPRTGVLKALERDAKRHSAAGPAGGPGPDPRPILLCFTSDPYQPVEEKYGVTREALKILLPLGLKVRILTKNPGLAIRRDLDILAPYRGQVEFGTTVVFCRGKDREYWEPHAPHSAERLNALRGAHHECIPTWLSLEPVIDPFQTLDILAYACDGDFVDVVKIGKLNHDKKREAKIDWTAFLRSALERLEGRRCGYYIKHDLWAFADEDIRAVYPKERAAEGV